MVNSKYYSVYNCINRHVKSFSETHPDLNDVVILISSASFEDLQEEIKNEVGILSHYIVTKLRMLDNIEVTIIPNDTLYGMQVFGREKSMI